MSSIPTTRHALHALQAPVPTATGRSASAALGPRSRPLASARIVSHRESSTVPIRRAQHVHLVRHRMGIVPHVLSALARHTRALGSSAPSVRLRMSSMVTTRHAQPALQALVPMMTGRSASAALARPSQPSVSVKTVLHRILSTARISRVHLVHLVNSRMRTAQSVSTAKARHTLPLVSSA